MPLFLDRLPLQRVTFPSDAGELVSWFPLLPLLISEPQEVRPPEYAICRLWKFDSGNTFDAVAWRFHVRRCGFYPAGTESMEAGELQARAASGTNVPLRLRRACLWLVSNIPHLRSTPYRLPLYRGLPFVDAEYPDPNAIAHVYPLLGMSLFRRAGLKVKIDFEDLTISVWTAREPWYTAPARLLRRIPNRFFRLGLDDLQEDRWIGSPN